MIAPAQTARINPEIDQFAQPIESARPHPSNPNTGDIDSIAESLHEFGQYLPVLVHKATGYIIKGNHTWKAARRLGWTHLAMVVRDIDQTTAERILAGDNRHSEKSVRDSDKLAALLLGAQQRDPAALLGTGYDQVALDDMLASRGQDRSLEEMLGSLDDDDERAAAARPAARKDVLTDTDARGKIPAAKLAGYASAGVRQVVLYFPSDEYDNVVDRLEAIGEAENLDNNTDVVRHLLETYEASVGLVPADVAPGGELPEGAEDPDDE